MSASYVLVVPDFTCVMPRLSNQTLLEISMSLFFLFVVAEMIGALLSNSLSLLGDSASMGVDVVTYICNIYGEWAKSNSRRSTARSRIVLEVVIPGLSTLSLLGVTLYVCIDAFGILSHPPARDDVNTNYLYGYATVNLLVDLACGLLFSLRGEDVFMEANQMPRLSLDTTVSFDQEEGDFGHLDDDLDGYMASAGDTTTWNPFGNGGGGGAGAGGSGGAYASVRTSEGKGRGAQDGTQVGFNCCSNALRLWAAFFRATCCCCCSGTGSSTTSGNATNSESNNSGKAEISNKKNLNMMSAFTHIMGDTLRTVSMLLAALVATITGIDGDICDAWAALVVSLTILVLCASLVIDICAAGRAIWLEEYAEGAPSGSRGRSRRSSSGSSSSVLGGVAYRRVNDLECDDLDDDGVEV